MDAKPWEAGCRAHARCTQTVVLAGRLVVLGMLVAALGLAVTDASRGILRQLVQAGQPTVIPVTLTETTLDPAVIVLRPGAVRFAVRNASAVPLRFSVRGLESVAQTGALPPGAQTQLDVTFAHPGTYVMTGGTPDAASDAPRGTLTVRR